jgi:hypothetical protein
VVLVGHDPCELGRLLLPVALSSVAGFHVRAGFAGDPALVHGGGGLGAGLRHLSATQDAPRQPPHTRQEFARDLVKCRGVTLLNTAADQLGHAVPREAPGHRFAASRIKKAPRAIDAKRRGVTARDPTGSTGFFSDLDSYARPVWQNCTLMGSRRRGRRARRLKDQS